MVIFWVAVAVFPDESVAVQVIVVTPSENTWGASLVNEIISTRSSAFTFPRSTELSCSLAASSVMSDTEIIGMMVSTTLIFC